MPDLLDIALGLISGAMVFGIQNVDTLLIDFSTLGYTPLLLVRLGFLVAAIYFITGGRHDNGR